MNPPTEYIPHQPGDLITAEDWNGLQSLIKADIASQISTAVQAIKRVDQAGNADTLTGKTLDAIEEEVARRVLEQLAGRTGYQLLFKRLKKDEEKIVAHGLKTCPLVDLYQLNYFLTVTAKDDEKVLQFVN